MSWQPRQNVFDLAPVIDNLFAYFQENQEAALNWASGGSALAPFQKFFTSSIGRVNTIFPSLMLEEKELATDPNNDVLNGVLVLSFTGIIQGGDTDELVRNAMLYAEAVESMMANVPGSVLKEGTNLSSAAIIAPLATKFDVLKYLGSAYFQVFRTRANYQLIGGSY